MLRSRMFTPGFRLFFGLSLFLLVGAALFGVSSVLQAEGTTVGDQLAGRGIIDTVLGPLTIGWKGSVGAHLGYTMLLGAAAVAAFLAVVLVAFRDADAEAEAQVLQLETVPLTRAPSGTNFAPLVAAFALGLMALGWVVNTALLYAGAGLLVLTAATWAVRAWAERATGDPEVNAQVYARIVDPLRVPVLSALAIAFVVLGLSRLLLAAPDKNWSSVIFGLAAVLFFGGVLAVYFLPRLARTLATALIVIGALALLAGGIYGIVKGERHTEGHTTEGPATEQPAGGTSEGGLGLPLAGVSR